MICSFDEIFGVTSVFGEAATCIEPDLAPGRIGVDCWQNGVQCAEAEGLFCLRTSRSGDGSPVASCTKLASLGERCNDDRSAPLDERVLCNLPDARYPQLPYVCEKGFCAEPPLEVGAPCSKALGVDCDDDCDDGPHLYCETVIGSSIPGDVGERCVSRDIKIGKACSKGAFGNDFVLCEFGADCDLLPTGPSSVGGGRGVCKEI